MHFRQEIQQAMEHGIMAVEYTDDDGEPYLEVWCADTRVKFMKDRSVSVYSMNINRPEFPYLQEESLGKHDRHKFSTFIYWLGNSSPVYIDMALRHAGIMEHEECDFCKFHHAPAGLHRFWR